MNDINDIIVLVGTGGIGQAIARRVSNGRTLLLADLKEENARAAAEVLERAGFHTETAQVNIAERTSIEALARRAAAMGNVRGLINSAGVSPSQASPEVIFKVDLYGTAVLLEEFGKVIAPGGSGVMIASQSGHRLGPLSVQDSEALATTPTEELLALPILQGVTDSLRAYQLSKRCNALRVMMEATRWSRRHARINCISPGIIYTPLAYDELNSAERGAGYRKMLADSPVGRGGTPDEVAALAALLMGPEGGFITGSDFLIDGGVTASWWYGDLKPQQ